MPQSPLGRGEEEKGSISIHPTNAEHLPQARYCVDKMEIQRWSRQSALGVCILEKRSSKQAFHGNDTLVMLHEQVKSEITEEIGSDLGSRSKT